MPSPAKVRRARPRKKEVGKGPGAQSTPVSRTRARRGQDGDRTDLGREELVLEVAERLALGLDLLLGDGRGGVRGRLLRGGLGDCGLLSGDDGGLLNDRGGNLNDGGGGDFGHWRRVAQRISTRSGREGVLSTRREREVSDLLAAGVGMRKSREVGSEGVGEGADEGREGKEREDRDLTQHFSLNSNPNLSSSEKARATRGSRSEPPLYVLSSYHLQPYCLSAQFTF